MIVNRSARYCRCGTRLARDNLDARCAACQVKARELLARPPELPTEFWDVEQMRDALATWHMGQVLATYRHHPFHGQVLRQEVVAGWVGLTQAQLSRIENGPAIKDLDRLAQWARTLGIPPHLLWFRLPEQRSGDRVDPAARHLADEPSADVAGLVDLRSWEIDDMDRRELLRLMSMAGAALATSRIDQLDWDRISHAGDRRISHATVVQYEALNVNLWAAFTSATSKAATLPLVQQQLGALTGSLRWPQKEAIHRRLCALAGDLFQLAGEILFDGNRYTEAAHCYTLAATASSDADAFDLWACALTRHAYISVYERQFEHAAPMLDLAATIAQRGDQTLSTGHWVHTVHANALAGLGDLTACQRALDHADQVHQLTGAVHNGGWLRFDGSRLAEERGTCFVELRRPERAEGALLDALAQDLSVRRRGGVLTDLAMVAVQRRDLDQLVMYADAAIDTARQTCSGVVGRRLQRLQPHLTPFFADRHARHLNRQITALTSTFT